MTSKTSSRSRLQWLVPSVALKKIDAIHEHLSLAGVQLVKACRLLQVRPLTGEHLQQAEAALSLVESHLANARQQL